MCKTNLTNDQRLSIFCELLKISNNGKLPFGTIQQIAEIYKLNRKTISNIWKKGQDSLKETGIVNVNSQKKGNSGRKKKKYNLDTIKDIPLEQRRSIRCLSANSNIPYSTLRNYIKDNEILIANITAKPLLKLDHTLKRILYVLELIDLYSPIPHFYNFNNILYIDEKNFYVVKVKSKFYILPNEETPYIAVQSKTNIEKLMFVSVIARPQYDSKSNQFFDGKIGIWPFFEWTETQRTTINRPKGIKIIEPVSVTMSTYKEMLLTNIIPKLKQVLPPNMKAQPLFLQQDNASPHGITKDKQILEALVSDGLNISFYNQPAQSPDLNILDLGIFNSIQATSYTFKCISLENLIQNVTKSYNSLTTEKINKTFITLQMNMINILQHSGKNNYKLPHMKYNDRLNYSKLSTSLPASKEAITNAIKHLEANTERVKKILKSK